MRIIVVSITLGTKAQEYEDQCFVWKLMFIHCI